MFTAVSGYCDTESLPVYSEPFWPLGGLLSILRPPPRLGCEENRVHRPDMHKVSALDPVTWLFLIIKQHIHRSTLVSLSLWVCVEGGAATYCLRERYDKAKTE